jgi:hypothetical protein
MFDRVEDIDIVRSPVCLPSNVGPNWLLKLTPLVIVEELLVNDGTSSTDMRNSGPGPLRRRDSKVGSSVNEDRAVGSRPSISNALGIKAGDGKLELPTDEGVSGTRYMGLGE